MLGFTPDRWWVFPRKLLKGRFDDGLVDSMANIVVLNEKANRAFSSKNPAQYVQEHKVSPERLQKQAVPDADLLQVGKFEDFLDLCSNELATRATAYIRKLGE